MTDTDLQLDLSTLDRDLADTERERAGARLSLLSPAGKALLAKMRQGLAEGRRSASPLSAYADQAEAVSAQRERDGGAIGSEGAVHIKVPARGTPPRGSRGPGVRASFGKLEIRSVSGEPTHGRD